jgi:hypothetical protein
VGPGGGSRRWVQDVRPVSNAAITEYGQPGMVCRVPLQRQYRWQCERPASTPHPDVASWSHPPPAVTGPPHPAAASSPSTSSATGRTRSGRTPARHTSRRARADAPRPATAPATRSPAHPHTTPRRSARTAHPAERSNSHRTPPGTMTAAPVPRPGHRLVLHCPPRPSSRSCFFRREHMITTRADSYTRTRRSQPSKVPQALPTG